MTGLRWGGIDVAECIDVELVHRLRHLHTYASYQTVFAEIGVTIMSPKMDATG
jgi:hypothetical protein